MYVSVSENVEFAKKIAERVKEYKYHLFRIVDYVGEPIPWFSYDYALWKMWIDYIDKILEIRLYGRPNENYTELENIDIIEIVEKPKP